MKAKRTEYKVVHREVGSREPQMGASKILNSSTVITYDLRELIDFERYIKGRTNISLFLVFDHTIPAGTTSVMVITGMNRTETADYYKCTKVNL